MAIQLPGRIVSILSIVLAVAGWSSCGKNDDQVSRVKENLEQLVPLGTDQARVVSVLDSLHIEHSGYDQTKHQILAISRNVSHTATTTTSVQITLQFDSTGKLITRDFKPVYTGP